ncbi:hypothetical protein [Butyrivibrio fibrisolvens]|uniref:hypothetical protein n=1 Tax=Butyrivibrio fibrisolvens TaxID=831 RepID=UPI00041BC9D1|nr:hypothetical protein [Butyrivibrio fibrisolvens]
MKKMYKKITGVGLVLCMMILFCEHSFAMEEYSSLKDSSKIFYPIITVQDVQMQFNNNAYSASQSYEDTKIALLGNVESISDNGADVYLNNDDSQVFVCSSSNNDIKAKVGELKKDQSIIFCGTVDSAESDTFKVKTENIVNITKDDDYYKDSYVCEDGTILLGEEHSVISIGAASFTINKNWVFDNIDDSICYGRLYKVSDNENLKVLGCSWDELEKEANKDDGIFSYFLNDFTSYENQVLEYWLGQKLDAIYKIDSFMPKTVKVSNYKYIYYSGKGSQDDSKKFEAFFFKNDKYVFLICYQYKDHPSKEANEIIYMLYSAKYDN